MLFRSTLRSCQRLCQQIRKRASKPLVSSRNMGRKNLTTRRTTDIAKILSNPPSPALRCVVRNDIARTLRTLWVGTLELRPTDYAQSQKRVAQVVENNCEVVSSKRLKIRVSAVRFCPRPPHSKSKPNPSWLGFFTSGLSPGCVRFPSILRVP